MSSPTVTLQIKNVSIQLHQALKIAAIQSGVPLGAFVTAALSEKVLLHQKASQRP